MDWVYLAISVNGAVYTLNAYVPVKRNRLLFGWSLFASWITIELAWAHLIWQVAATAYFARKGALRTSRGKLALVINVASWIGLGVLMWRSLGVRHEVRAAFNDLDMAPTRPRRFGVKRTRNIPFATVGRKELKLDVYEPARVAEDTRDQRRPAIVQIHGGAWVFGDKREQGLPLLRHLASEGWVGFNVNYRLSPRATFPDHLIDVKRAVAWIREHADEYHVDPNFIVVTGGSAGGHLAALVGLTADDPTYQPGFEEADTSVQAVVPFYAVYDFTDRRGYYPPDVVKRFFGRVVLKAKLGKEPDKFVEASPMYRVHPDAPPFFVIHGTIDTLAPVAMARDFVDELKAVSKAPVLYLELKGAQHAFEVFPSIRANEVVRAVRSYLDRLHDEYRAGVPVEDVPAEELADAVDDETDGSVTA